MDALTFWVCALFVGGLVAGVIVLAIAEWKRKNLR
ncbi:hypothetical protein ES703_58742 [subsurface metagenome]